MKRLKKLLLPLSLLAIVPITTIPVVACSKTSNSDNVVQPPLGPNGDIIQPSPDIPVPNPDNPTLPPIGGENNPQLTPPAPSNPTQPNINRNYALSSEFAKIYPKEFFDENIKLMETFDGSNKMGVNKKNLTLKDITCLNFQASGNTIELTVRALVNKTSQDIPNTGNVGEESVKYEYVSPTSVKKSRTRTIDLYTSPASNKRSTSGSSSSTIPVEYFREDMLMRTIAGFRNYLAYILNGTGEDDLNGPTSPSQPLPQPTPPNSNGNQPQISHQYNITGEFAKYYTKSMFEDNLRLMKMFDGSNKIGLNIPQPGSNKPFRFLLAKDHTCLRFQTYENSVEMYLRALVNPQYDAISNNSNNGTVSEVYQKFEYASPTEIKLTSYYFDSSILLPPDPPSTSIIPMSEFEAFMNFLTPENGMKLIEYFKIAEGQN